MRLIDLQERVMSIPPKILDQIRAWRHDCRNENGSGGMCHEVTAIIQNKYGWDRMSGTYCDKTSEGDPICVTHFWNVLSDGTIIDPTADQLGEEDIRIVRPEDPAYQQYRPEWSADYHPNHPDFPIGDEVHDHKWSGEFDFEWSMNNRRPAGWWLDDLDKLNALLQYHRQSLQYSNGEDEGDQQAIRDIKARIKQLSSG